MTLCSLCQTEYTTTTCSICGSVNPLLLTRIREAKNRPKRIKIDEVESQNNNGTYDISVIDDGSFFCGCPSFLTQKGLDEEGKCKHLRWSNGYQAPEGFVKRSKTTPTEWQVILLKKLGVELHPKATNAQAYFLVNDLLAYNGSSFTEIKKELKKNASISFLPVKSVGIEIEHASPLDREELARKIVEAGVPAASENYNHNQRPYWKLVNDGSIRTGNDFIPVEVVSPKLFGVKGFKDLTKVCKVIQTVGYEQDRRMNKTCGLHIHVDGYEFLQNGRPANFPLLIELIKAWWKSYPIIAFLVSPSRVNRSGYCRQPDEHLLRMLSQFQCPDDGNRYYSLNLASLHRHGTVENRLHGFTVESNKIIPWAVFSVLFIDAVVKGLRHREIPTTDPAEFFNIIGMGENSIKIIRESRRFLLQRYEHFKSEGIVRRFTPMPEDIERLLSPHDIEEIEEIVLVEEVENV